LLGLAIAGHLVGTRWGIKHRDESPSPRWEGLGVPLDRAPCGVGEAGDPMLRVTPGPESRLRVLRSTVLWEALGYCSSRRLWLGFKLFTLKGFLIW